MRRDPRSQSPGLSRRPLDEVRNIVIDPREEHGPVGRGDDWCVITRRSAHHRPGLKVASFGAQEPEAGGDADLLTAGEVVLFEHRVDDGERRLRGGGAGYARCRGGGLFGQVGRRVVVIATEGRAEHHGPGKRGGHHAREGQWPPAAYRHCCVRDLLTLLTLTRAERFPWSEFR